jgi:hypothetical protein
MSDWDGVLPVVPAGDVELRHGYPLGAVNRLAMAAVRRDVWHRSLPVAERLEIAWSAIVESLYDCENPPPSSALIRAAWNAMRAHVENEWHTHGVSRTRSVYEGDQAMPNYWRYWWPQTRTTSSPENWIVEQMALWQIWEQLRPRHQELLMALAIHDDYGLAAKSLGYDKRQTYVTLLSKARREFFELSHEGEQPSRMWGQDRRRRTPGARQNSATTTLSRRTTRRRQQANS